MIELIGVEKSFKDLQVLKGVDLTIDDGKIICLIGPSGSGKSTLLRCINGMEEATKGTILVDGVEATSRFTDMNKLRESVGFVFQNFNLFPHMSVVENITLAPVKVRKLSLDEARATAEDLLSKVGLSDKIEAFPQQLSGGQRQRVAIARALAMHPKYMLFDEPTSALDPEMIGEVLEVIRQLAHAGMTMGIVTHEMNFAREISSSIAFMDDGVIVEQAPPDEFFDAPKTRRAADFIAKIL